MKFLNNTKFKSIVNKCQTTAIAVSIAAFPVINAYAGANELVSRIIGTIGNIFQLIGAILLCWSIGQLVMAFKNEDADSKSRAALVMVSSVLLVTMPTILTALLQATGTSISAGTTLLN